MLLKQLELALTVTRMATTKQKLALAKIAENGGNVSKAMREVGYSEISSKTPAKLVKSKGFQELLAQAGATDEKLMAVLKEGLDAQSTHVTKDGDEVTIEKTPDYATRHKYLDTALKIRGAYPKEGNNPNINFNFGQVADQQRDKYGV